MAGLDEPGGIMSWLLIFFLAFCADEIIDKIRCKHD
jgi:hypothetical protein